MNTSPSPRLKRSAKGFLDKGRSLLFFIILLSSATCTVLSQEIHLKVASTTIEVDRVLEIPITSSVFSGLTTLQFTLSWNPSVLEYASVSDFGLPGVHEAVNFGAAQAAEGKLTFSWDDTTFQGIEVAADQILFKIAFKGIGEPGLSSFVDIDGSLTLLEASVANLPGNPIVVPVTVQNGVVDLVEINTPPTISGLANVTLFEGAQSAPVAFNIGDGETDPAHLSLSVQSSAPGVISPEDITFEGAGGVRTLVARSMLGSTGSSTITVVVSDGLLTASTDFLITVEDLVIPPTEDLYRNESNSLELNFPFSVETGDEVILAKGGFDQISGGILTRYEVGFNANQAAVGKEVTAIVRLYKNDGALVNGFNQPGTLVHESGLHLIELGLGNVITVENIGVALPNSFTWSLEISGLSEGEEVYLPLFNPPTIGNNTSDFWQRNEEGGWSRLGIADIQANFLASFEGYIKPPTGGVFVGSEHYDVVESGVLIVDDTDHSTPEEGDNGVLLNDGNPNGDALIATLIEPPKHALNFNFLEDGTFTYEHNGDDVLEDSFTYLATDGFHVEIGEAFITIEPLNDNPPVFDPEEFLEFGEVQIESATTDTLTIQVPEGVEIGQDLIQLYAIDTDQVPNIELLYELQDASVPDVFGVDAFSGVVVLLQSLDFERLDHYTFTIKGTEQFVVEQNVLEDDMPVLSSTLSVTVNVLDVDDESPVILNELPLLVDEGGQAVLTADVLSASDVDSGGETLVGTIMTPPQFGVVHYIDDDFKSPISEFFVQDILDGYVVYTHDGSENFTDSFEITARDQAGNTSEIATIFIEVSPVNDPPIAAPDTTETDEKTLIVIDVLNNDFDEENPESLIISNLNLEGTVGLVEITDGNTVLYDPLGLFDFIPAGLAASDQFSYTVQDPEGAQSEALVTVHVLGVNDAPVAMEDFVETDEDTPLTFPVLDNDMDVDDPEAVHNPILIEEPIGSGVLQVVEFTQPDHGIVEFDHETQAFTYTPELNFFGEESFNYTITDGFPESVSTATVFVVVHPVNDPPVALDDGGVTDEDTFLDLNVLANDADVENPDELFISSIDHAEVMGSIEVISPGVLRYDPVGLLDFLAEGEEWIESFFYTVEDQETAVSTAQVSITVVGVNDVPVAVDDEVETMEDTPVEFDVLANDEDVDVGSSLAVKDYTQPANGTVTYDPETGLFSFTPHLDFNGTDFFDYVLTDGFPEGEATASVFVTVHPVNDAPFAEDDFFDAIPRNIGGELNLMANDFDLDAEDVLTIVSVGTSEAGGLVSLIEDTITGRSSRVDYVPPFGFTGEDSFEYTISDLEGETATATVFVVVTGENTPPVVRGLMDRSMDVGQTPDPVTFILEDDATPLGEISLTVTSDNPLLLPQESVIVGGEGTQRTLTFIPGEGVTGRATVTLLLLDTEEGQSEYSFTLRVFPINQELGRVYDGYVAGGTVFFDANLNGVNDSNEPSTMTNGRGEFDLEVRVSEFDKNDNLSIDPNEGVLVIQGGTDIATGLPLKTDMKAPAGSSVISPLTSVIVEVQKADLSLSPEQAATLVSEALNLGVDLLNYDAYTAAREGDLQAASVIRETLKVQDTAVMLGGFFEGTGATSTSSTATQFYRELAARVAVGSSVNLSDPNVISDLTVNIADHNDVNLGGEGSSLPDVRDSIVRIIQESNTRKDTAAGLDLSPVEIAAELTKVSIVSQGKTTDDLAAVGADYAVKDDVEEANTGTALDEKISEAQVGDLTGDGGKPGAFQFLSNAFEVIENGHDISPVTVVRQDGNRGEARLLIQFEPLTATLGSDYVGTPIEVVFEDFEVRKIVTLQSNLIDDNVAEPVETFLMSLSTAPDSPLQEVIGSIRRAEVRIVDNDQPPVANDDSFEVNEDQTLLIPISSLLANDSDSDPQQTLSLGSFNAQSQAGGSLQSDGEGGLLYTPPLHFNGIDRFTYTVFDDTERSDSAVVTIIVTPVNDPPTLSEVADLSTRTNRPITFSVELSDVDHAATALQFDVVPSSTLISSFQVLGTGANREVQITPAPDQAGEVDIELRVTDPLGGVGSTTFRLVVTDRVLSLDTSFELPGGQVSHLLSLVSEGNESQIEVAIGFPSESLEFLGANLMGGTELIFDVNSSGADTGFVQLTVSQPSGLTFSAGSHTLVHLTFNIGLNTSLSNLPIQIGGATGITRILDVEGVGLPFDVEPGSVRVIQGLEGDLATRPDGDGRVSLIDWIQSGRFVSSIDEIQVSNGEFARADVAPLVEKGNGEFGLEDWVQAGRFVAGLDTPGSVGGPIEPDAFDDNLLFASVQTPSGIALFSGSPVLIGLKSKSVLLGETVHLPVTMNAHGQVNAVSFTLKFEPEMIEILSIKAPASGLRPTIIKNMNLLSHGILPVAIALAPGQSWAGGLQDLVDIEMQTLAEGVTQFEFIDHPTAMRVVGPEAQTLASQFETGSLDILGLSEGQGMPAMLRLKGWSADHELVLELRGQPGFYTIEYSTDLIHWDLLVEGLKLDGPMLIKDDQADTRPGAFYRVKSETETSHNE